MTPHAKPWTEHYRGVPENIESPTGSLIDLLDDAVAGAGDRPALTFDGRETSYAELGRQVASVAEGLRRLGVGVGDRVALLLPDCPQHVVAFFAVLRLGAIVVDHDPRSTKRDLRAVFHDHGARVAIAWDKSVAKISGRGFALDTIVAVTLLDELSRRTRMSLSLPFPTSRSRRAELTASTEGTVAWASLRSNPPLAHDHPRPAADDPAVISYTARFKGAMLSHLNLHASARQAASWLGQSRPTIYALVPSHAFVTVMVSGMAMEGNLVLFYSADADAVLDAAASRAPTVMWTVPPMFAALAERRRAVDLTVSISISPVPVRDDIASLWESLTGGVLIETYGMAECSHLALGHPCHLSHRTGTAGIPFPSTQMRVEPSAAGYGELLLLGPQVFSGYWGDEKETRKALSADGWLRTGDLVTVDEDGFVTVIDPIGDLIATAGMTVVPSEVESVLVTHPSIVAAAVIGFDRGAGSDIIGAVVIAKGVTLDTEDVRSLCRQHLPEHAVPRRIVPVLELPTLPSGVVDRKQVRAEIEPYLTQ